MRVEEYKKKEFQQQIDAMRQGLTSVVPAYLLNYLNWKELEVLLCGSPEIDLDLLKAHTEYQGFTENEPLIQNFWKVMESFTNDGNTGHNLVLIVIRAFAVSQIC